MSNRDVGGRLVEMAETEYMVRSSGYIQSIEDLKSIPVTIDKNGTPIRLQDVAQVHTGPELRRGLVDLDGEGEVAGGVVIMRYGENALATIKAVREKLESLKSGLPDGVEIVPVYDRGDLIERAVKSLNTSLFQEYSFGRFPTFKQTDFAPFTIQSLYDKWYLLGDDYKDNSSITVRKPFGKYESSV